MRDGGNVLGVLGTGIDLTSFIRDVVAIPQLGVQSMFVDRSGAIQAHRDPKMVDYHSLTNETKNKKTIFALLDEPRPISEELGQDAERPDQSGKSAVESRFMHVDGREYLVGVGYLDRLGWFNVTLMDVNKIIDRRLFLPIGLLLAAIMFIAIAMMTLLFKRSVLDRLARARKCPSCVRRIVTSRVKAGRSRARTRSVGLSRAFARMANAVGDHTEVLESMVRERTESLRRLADLDPLTGICNRRGFLDAATALRAERCGRHGVLLIDMDLFKTINDAFGHQGGDAVLAKAAERLKATLGPRDVCGRWGGDEFIVLADCEDDAALAGALAAILDAMSRETVRLEGGQIVRLTISIGGVLLAVG